MTSTSDPSSTPADAALVAAYRTDWGRLLSVLVARTRRLDLAEDALGEAFARAAERWPVDGVPANSAGWLYSTAHRQVLDRLRAEAVAGRKLPLLAVRSDWAPGDPADELPDERLHLILLCCHPALPKEARSALALRLVIGTPTEQIARLFLVPTATMAARLTRAKKKIAAAGIPLGVPVSEELGHRLDEVCRTIYLAFTAGYTPGAGPTLLRPDLAGEAARLATVLSHLVPRASQARALVGLLVLQHSRRDAREQDGQLVALADQDRTRWHHDEIRVGLEAVATLRPGSGYAEELRLQARIAAEHAKAPSAEATDWSSIARLYADLEARTGSAVVRLNRAVAVAQAAGPRQGLALLDELDPALPTSYRLPAVRGALAHQAGNHDLAVASYRAAIQLCTNDIERRHLLARVLEIEGAGQAHPGERT